MDKIIEDVLKKMTLEEKASFVGVMTIGIRFLWIVSNLNSIRMGGWTRMDCGCHMKNIRTKWAVAQANLHLFLPLFRLWQTSWDPNLVFGCGGGCGRMSVSGRGCVIGSRN
jgi:hypothetical protein